jgi:hypothetical protein
MLSQPNFVIIGRRTSLQKRLYSIIDPLYKYDEEVFVSFEFP